MEVQARIDQALAALPKDFAPRTRHYDGRDHKPAAGHDESPYAPAGARPNYTNRLILETSPYLRQHAHNPVDWRPWGPEAFAEARALGRPIFLSVGYATCHWCHVMEAESFEDPATAYTLNSLYIPIKVDREERPDVDAVYMAAVQRLTGSGGWPMSVWIAPGLATSGAVHGVPYFGGTYFPPVTRGRQQGFGVLLQKMAEQYAEDPSGIADQGGRLVAAVRSSLAAGRAGQLAATTATDAVAAVVGGQYDRAHGGLRRAPKFPSQMPISLLLRHHLRTGDVASKTMAAETFAKMAAGGMYDQVGGGFHRYSTDERWFAPHFEKMLYDQALITFAGLDVLQATDDAEVRRVIRETLDYVLRELRGDEGAMRSATDADSEGREGLYFLWTVQELEEVLGAKEGQFVASVTGAVATGNFEGRNILYRSRRLAEVAEAEGASVTSTAARLRADFDRLRVVRDRRVPPLMDDKILASWNGLAISALARAGFVLDEPRYTAAAVRAGRFVLDRMRSGGRLLRVWHGGKARINGFLDDYAFLIQGFLDVLETTGDPFWLGAALQLQRDQDRLFADGQHGGYFATASDNEALIARERPDYDGAEPSGNSVAALNLVRIAAMTGDPRWSEAAESTLRGFGQRLTKAPMALTDMLVAVEAVHAPMREVVLVRPAGSDEGAFAPFLAALRGRFLPHRVLLRAEEGAGLAALAALAPIAEGKVARGGKVTAYVCIHGSCRLPTTDPKVMVAQVEAKPAAP